MKVLNEYPNSHHYLETWEPKPKLFCPICGVRGKLFAEDSGDYYAGCQYICVDCGESSYLDGAGGKAKQSIVEQLRSGVTHEPTTKKGG